MENTWESRSKSFSQQKIERSSNELVCLLSWYNAETLTISSIHLCSHFGETSSKVRYHLWKKRFDYFIEVSLLMEQIEKLSWIKRLCGALMVSVFCSCYTVQKHKEREVNFAITAGWTPNKQFCFSKSAPFRILSPHSKLWYHICIFAAKWSNNCGGFKVTCSRSKDFDC